MWARVPTLRPFWKDYYWTPIAPNNKFLVGGLVDKITGTEMKSLFLLNNAAKTTYTLAKKTRAVAYMFD